MPIPQSISRSSVFFFSLYFFVALGYPIGGITSVTVQQVLKGTFHARPFDMAVFNACAAIPLYFGFVFGMVRDGLRSSPFGDRELMLLGASIALAAYVYLALTGLTYGALLAASVVIVLGLVMIATATQALMTIVARERSMTGWFSAVWNIGVWVPELISFPVGGWLAAHVPARTAFFIGAAIAAVALCHRFFIPRVVEHAAVERRESPQPQRIGTMLSHRGFWPVLAIVFLFMLSPGWQTPLFYHLTDKLGLSTTTYGLFLATLATFQIPGAIFLAWALRRFPLKRLLWWGTVFMILQAPMPLLMRDGSSVFVSAVLAALFFGVGCSAYWALVMRACVSGLEGTGYMLALATAQVAAKAGDLLGSWLYELGGLPIALAINTATSVLIIPMLLLLPSSMVDAKDAAVD